MACMMQNIHLVESGGCLQPKAPNRTDKPRGGSALRWDIFWNIFIFHIFQSNHIIHVIWLTSLTIPPVGELQCLQHGHLHLQRFQLLRLWHRLLHCGDFIHIIFNLNFPRCRLHWPSWEGPRMSSTSTLANSRFQVFHKIQIECQAKRVRVFNFRLN